MEETVSDIESIEAEAEKILQSASGRANEVLLKSKEEASRILSSDLPLGEVQAECQEIVRRAKEEAKRVHENSVKQASQIRADADSKIARMAERLAAIVAGDSSR